MKKIYIFILSFLCHAAIAQTDSIQASTTSGCHPLTVSFRFSASGVQHYQWDFGNGSTSSIAEPNVLYDEAGDYEIKLTATLANGQTKTFTLDAPIQVVNKPTADFTFSLSSICTGDSIMFNNITTGATSYLWDFGDGNTSTLENPRHAYTNTGTYSVTLIATSEFGCAGVKVQSNVINVSGIEGLDLQADNTSACVNSVITFTASGNHTTQQWDLGDGAVQSGNSVQHIYTSPGIYSVTLNTEGQNGCQASLIKTDYIEVFALPESTVSYTDSIVCQGNEVTFMSGSTEAESISWSFSDGFTSSENPLTRDFSTAGNFSFTMTATNTDGCSSAQQFNDAIQVVSSSTPVVHTTEKEGCVPHTVTFNNTTPDGTAFSWEVDGLSLQGASVSHTFTEPGIYSFKAHTLHTSGCENTLSYDSVITVHTSEVSIIASATTGCIPLNSSLSLSNPSVSNVLWDLGNGVTRTGNTVEAQYATPGNYNVQVTFINQYGCTETLALTDPITALDTAIHYEAPPPIQTCKSVNVFFNGGMGRDSWYWDFGDGNTSTIENPVHVYDRPGTYNVSLTTHNANGCPTTISSYNQIIVNDLSAAFRTSLADTSQQCPKFSVKFESLVPEATRYLWDFGDNTVSTEANPVHEYTSTAQINVRLKVWNDAGCQASIIGLVSPPNSTCIPPDPDIPLGDGGSIDVISNYGQVIKFCATPATVQLANPQPRAVSWRWSFGDGNTSTVKNPDHTFTSEGVYPIDVISYFDDGGIDTLRAFTTVVIKAPEIDFEYSGTSTCDGTRVTFTNTSALLHTSLWEFGNGDSSKEANAEITYTVPGVYQIALTASDTLGCEAKIVKNIIIGNPYPLYDYNRSICDGEQVSITHNIKDYKRLEWDFGDGNSSTELYPTHLYATPGKYTVTVNAIDINGCGTLFSLPHAIIMNNPIANFQVLGNSSGCNELEASFESLSSNAEEVLWDFGDGTTSSKANPVKTFNSGNFSIALVASQGQCSDSLLMKDLIQVDEILADFDYSQDQLCLPITVQFTDKSTNATGWRWNFGDGTLSAERNPTHTYHQFPNQNIALEITNGEGCTHVITKPLENFFRSDFTVNNVEGCKPLSVDFSSNAKDAVKWFWDFGDGHTSTMERPNHIYTEAGSYTIKLISRSATGCYDTLVRKNYVEVSEVNALFSADINDITCSPLLVSFQNNSTGASKYHWDFGDSATSTNATPFHTYTSVDAFDVRLIAENELGCRDTTQINNFVTTIGPETSFIISDSTACHPQEIQFEDKSAAAVEWEWFFGDGNSSTEPSPRHTYDQPGSYTVSLLATGAKGCKQVVKYEGLQVFPSPKAEFRIDEYKNCQPVTVNVTNTSENLQNETYLWDLGNSVQSTLYEPEIVYGQPGSFSLSLTVTNEQACSDTFGLENDIIVYDTAFIAEPDVLQLSVTENSSIDALYTPFNKNHLKYHVVYKETGSMNFTPYDTIYTSTSDIYRDVNVHPLESTYAYRFQTHTHCQPPADLVELTTYRSIKINAAATPNNIQVIWTPYEGHDFEQYAVLRKPTGGNWQEIARVPKKQRTFIDQEDLCPNTYTYQVQALDLEGSSYSSSSNTDLAMPTRNVFLDQQVEIVRSTVENNTFVFTEWKAPKIGPDKVAFYQVLRSTDGINFTPIIQVPPGITSYVDEQVDVTSESYTYKVNVINTCAIGAKESNLSTSLLLQKHTRQYQNLLFWTPYSGWAPGVKHYLLQQMDEYGTWQTVEVLDNEQNSFTIDLSETDQ